MAEILNHPRVYSFLHIPVQAGSDRVLEEMKREYTVYDFNYVVDYLKQRFVNIQNHNLRTSSTDGRMA